MGYGTWKSERNQPVAYVIDEMAKCGAAMWQLVVEREEGVAVLYLGQGDDLEFWKGECVRLFGVYPRVFGQGSFVEVKPEG